MSFAQNFTMIKENLGISNYKIAKYLNCSQSTVANYADGSTEPTLSTITKIAEFLNVQISDLTGTDEQDTKTEHKIKLLARKADELPAEKREELLAILEANIDVFLKTAKKPKED